MTDESSRAPISESEGEREAKRLAVLEHLRAIRPEADHVLQELVDEVRGLFGTGLCMVNLLLSDALYFRAWSGNMPAAWAEARLTSRDGEMCDHVAQTEGPLIVDDLSTTQQFVDHPAYTVHGIRFYAGTPLITSEGHRIGILCVADARPREFGERDLAALAGFAKAVVGRLEQLGALERERTAAEREARRNSELGAVYQRLDSHVENSPLGVFEWDKDLRILRWSEGATRIFGWRAEEVVGRSISDLRLVHEEDQETVDDLVFKRLLSGDERRVVFKNRNRTRDGKIVCCEWYSSVLVDESGELVSVMSLALDVTEREKWEKKLAESEERYHALTDAALEGIVILEEGRILEANRAYAAITGYELPELIGKHVTEFTAPESVELVRRNATSGYAEPYEAVGLRKDGTRFYKELHGRASTYRGRPVRVTAVRDVTQRKEAEEALRKSEEQFRSLVQNSSDVITILDESGTIRYESPAAERMLGHGAEALIGRNVFDFLHPEDIEGASVKLAECRANPGTNLSIQTRKQHADGSWRLVESVVNNLLEDPAVKGIVVNTRDITERKKAEEDLKESEERYRAVVEQSVESIFLFDAASKKVLECNTALRQLLGYTSEELEEMAIYDFIAHDKDDIDSNIRRDLIEKRRFVGERQYRRKDGSLVDVEVSTTATPYRSGEALCVVARDVTERKRAAESLRRSEARNKALLDATPDLMFRYGRDGTYVDIQVNDPEKLYLPRKELLGHNLGELLPPEIAGQLLDKISRTLDTGEMQTYEYQLEVPGGTLDFEARLVVCEVEEVLCVVRDVTERKTLERQLAHQAFHDALTDLPNRNLFMDRLSQALARVRRREDTRVAVLFMDLDNFKVVNDSLGHEAGDKLLVAVSERLSGCLRPEDTVARLGGDELGVLLEGVADEGEATRVARRISRELKAPIALGEHEVFVGVSVGISFGSAGGDRPEDLLRRADVAMYEAKRKGKDQHEVFVPRMDARVLERLRLETDLRKAIEREEFRVHYQPQVYLDSGAIVGFEALVRWEHPEKGLVPPMDFIPVAEETGLIVPIGQWVLEEACRQVMEWGEDLRGVYPPGALAVSVNLSARQFQQKDLAHDVLRVLEASGLPAGSLILEITESVAMEDAPLTTKVMRELKALDIRLAIDDFGTGYSSLAYLRRFPTDYLKIDRAFVGGLGKNPEDRMLVEGVIGLAHILGLKVVAEGVETTEQLAELREMQCELGQGYHFSRPLPSQAASRLLTTNRLRP